MKKTKEIKEIEALDAEARKRQPKQDEYSTKIEQSVLEYQKRISNVDKGTGKRDELSRAAPKPPK